MVETVKAPDSVRVKGNCKWFNDEKGFGFIVAEGFNRDIFIHRQQLVRSGITGLAEGETVTFVVCEGNKGMYATSVTKEPVKCQ